MQVYPGHDYLANNLAFTLSREPGNQAAIDLLPLAKTMNPDSPLVTTIAQERQINTFFRLEETEVIETLRADFPDLPQNPDPKTVFLKLRELRNHW